MRAVMLAVLLGACSGGSPSHVDANGGGGADATTPDGLGQPTRFVAYVSGGANIAWYDVDKVTGALTAISSVAAFRTGASFLAFHDNYVYAVASGNRVGAYSIDPATAAITFINDVDAGGTGPTHVAVDATGTRVLVANYGSGHIAVYPVRSDGGLSAASQTLLAGAKAHQIVPDPSNQYVVVPCLGDNKVAQYVLSSGALAANATPQLGTASGAGPRHIAFTPDGTHAYLVNELDSTLSALAFDTSTGRLSELQTLSTRAAGATGGNTGAEVVVHPSGKWVYSSNRGDNNIAVFSIGTDAKVTLIANTSTQGMTPRNFTIDPSGRFLYAANQNSSTVVPFAIDTATGKLTPTAASISVPTPQFVGIIELPE